MVKLSSGLLLFVFLAMQVMSVSAEDLGVFGSRIFKFQERLAKKGNTMAEYKLGTLYEFGVSVKASNEQAIKWYEKAAKKNYSPAINRLTYLEIRKTGYDKAKHGAWFEKLKQEVKASDANAMILLGQMYHYGIKMDKNLKKSLAWLERASALGHTEVDSEIDEIRLEIDEAEKAMAAKNKSAEEVIVEKPAARKEEKKPVSRPKKSDAKKEQQKAKRRKEDQRRIKEEKRRKYEEAMRKLREEEKLLEQQQDWAEDKTE